MSSIRNSIPSRNYRERAQPQSRARLGLLEKHKDYKLRARDHNAKKAKLRALQAKAHDRNPDEFYFGMMSSKTDKDGRKIAEDGGRGNKPLSQEVVQLLKTQDIGYIRTMLQRVVKERERLEQEMIIVEKDGVQSLRSLKDHGETKKRHRIFVDDQDEQKTFEPQEWFGTDEKGLERAFNRRRKGESTEQVLMSKPKTPKQQEAETAEWKEMRRQQKKKQHDQEMLLSRMESVKARERDLIVAERELDLQRAQMNNSVGGMNKNGIKFKVRERKT